ncbi:unnamed protein product [Cylicostephanus goldi]|uniref:Uncharacterized protein n=1 Tax=Cylicostephanus goldi TaxID=71465 RepID=A0A3P7QDQ4_CYLGO|nr:unnamed protein product [Cylicostephanus goldi]
MESEQPEVRRRGRPRVFASDAERQRNHRSIEGERRRALRLSADAERHLLERQNEDAEHRSIRRTQDSQRHREEREVQEHSSVLKDDLLMLNVNRDGVREKMMKSAHDVDPRTCNGSEGVVLWKARKVDLHVVARTHFVSRDDERLKVPKSVNSAFWNKIGVSRGYCRMRHLMRALNAEEETRCDRDCAERNKTLKERRKQNMCRKTSRVSSKANGHWI